MNNVQDAINTTKNFNRMKISVSGVLCRISRKKGNLSNFDRFCLEEIDRLYHVGKEAWLKGDLNAVGEMFGILN